MGGEDITMSIDQEAQNKIDMLEAELAEMQADLVVAEERLIDTENQLAAAIGQMSIMRIDCRYEADVLQ